MRMAGISRLIKAFMLVTAATSITITEAQYSVFALDPIIRNCRDVQLQYGGKSGIYYILPYRCSHDVFKVYCDMDTDGGGWTVIQRRDDIIPREDFFRNWNDYIRGFGNLEGEFWLGLELIHTLTEQISYEARIDLEDFDNQTAYEKYQSFHVYGHDQKYKLNITGYSGNATDRMSLHSGMAFSTKDRDNDDWPSNCADTYKGGWWYRACYHSNLNGQYLSGQHTTRGIGIDRYSFQGLFYSLKKTEIKIRPTY